LAAPTAADLRTRDTLEPAERVAQPGKLVAEPLVSCELSLDLLDPRLASRR
jgi:hypothetical protein